MLQLLYVCSVAIVKLTAAGTILLMNPFGAQLFRPVAVDGALNDLSDIFDRFAPEVAEMVRRPEGRVGKGCEEHRVMLPPRSPTGPARSLHHAAKVDADTSVAVMTDVTSMPITLNKSTTRSDAKPGPRLTGPAVVA